MSENLPFALSDQPILDSQSDTLRLQAFARNLAHVIRRLDREKSTVLALTGPWGSGKTSIKNLVIEELKSAQNAPRVLEFSPWQVSGTGNISMLFFEAVLGEISKEQATPDESRKRKENVRKYASFLSRGSAGMGGLASVLSFMGAVGVPLASVGATLAQQASQGMKALGETSNAVAPEQPIDLQELKAEISTELTQLTQQILIVIDDIDRLPIAEISEIVQLINVNADFPNLHYLLLFDRQTVEKSIENSFPGKGKQFLEKIIQASYHAPVLTRSDLEKEFSHYLGKWIEGTAFAREINREELTTLFDTALCRYLGNVRHIKRLISSLSFYAAQFQSGDSTEVNAVDLIALEALRQFEPDVYEALPRHKSDLAEGGLAEYMTPEQTKEQRLTVLEVLLQHASQDRKELVRKMIELIFPPIKKISGHDTEGWLKARRVCHSTIFDRYFSYRLGKADISQSDLDAFVRSANDRDYVLGFFEEQSKRDLFRASLERLLLRVQEINGGKAETVAKALIDFCDKIPVRGNRFYFEDEVYYGSALFMKMVRNLTSQNHKDRGAAACQVVRSLFEETQGLYVPISFCTELTRLQNKEIGRSIFDIKSEQITELEGLIAAKIERRAHESGLLDDPRLTSLLFFWFGAGDKIELQKYLKTEIEDQRHLFQFLRAIVRQRDFPRTALSKNPYLFGLEDVEALIGVDTIKDRVSAVDQDSLKESERFLIEAFQWALEDRSRAAASSQSPDISVRPSSPGQNVESDS